MTRWLTEFINQDISLKVKPIDHRGHEGDRQVSRPAASVQSTDKTDKSEDTRQNIAEVTGLGTDRTDKTINVAAIELDFADLEASKKRLESARISIAVWDDGRHSILNSESARSAGGTRYTPDDIWHYLQLQPHDRKLLHSFKRAFGGTTEWKTSRNESMRNSTGRR